MVISDTKRKNEGADLSNRYGLLFFLFLQKYRLIIQAAIQCQMYKIKK